MADSVSTRTGGLRLRHTVASPSEGLPAVRGNRRYPSSIDPGLASSLLRNVDYLIYLIIFIY